MILIITIIIINIIVIIIVTTISVAMFLNIMLPQFVTSYLELNSTWRVDYSEEMNRTQKQYTVCVDFTLSEPCEQTQASNKVQQFKD